MQETIYLHDGLGIIYLRGGPIDTFLYVRKEPRLAIFYAEVGTIWRYLVGREISEKLLHDNYRYEALVAAGRVAPGAALADQFKHVLKLLSNGSYQLSLEAFLRTPPIVPAISHDDPTPYYDHYGGLVGVTATQTYLDQAKVEEYKIAIHRGDRPIVVLLKIKGSNDIFLLDGHHKLTAYNALKVVPQTLLITKLDTKPMRQEEGSEILQQLGLQDKDWLRKYSNEKRQINS